MVKFSPSLKHHILTQYQPSSTTHNFSALARLYAIPGGHSTIYRWHERWNGTPQSLEKKHVSGRPRKLSKRQVDRYIRIPIRNKRRRKLAVHCTDLMPSIHSNINKEISLRTIQRYAKRDVGTKLIHTKKKTRHECQCVHVRDILYDKCIVECLLIMICYTFFVCPLSIYRIV